MSRGRIVEDVEYGHSVSIIDNNSTCKWVVLTNVRHSALLSGLILCLTTRSSRDVPVHVLIDILHVYLSIFSLIKPIEKITQGGSDTYW